MTVVEPAVVLLDPAVVAQHPGNVRDASRGIDELAASIAEVGVLVPLIVVPVDRVDGEFPAGVTHVAVDGNRRQRAAVKAGAQLPCLVRPDLADARHTATTMAVTGLVRDGFTVAEEVAATQLLLDLGVDEAAIARATARPVERVAQARVAAGLKKAVAKQAAKHDLDLEDMAALAEFQGDKRAVDTILQQSEFGRTRHAVEQLRREREEAAVIATRRAELEAKGVTVLDQHPRYGSLATRLEQLYGGDGKTLTSSKHRKCPGHAVYLSFGWNGKLAETAYCLDPKKNDHGKTPAGPKGKEEPSEEQKAERRELLRRNKEMAAAESVRREFIRAVITRPEHPRDLTGWALERIVRCDSLITDWLEKAGQWGGPPVAGELLGVDEPVKELRSSPPARHALLVWVLVVSAYEARFQKDTWRCDRDGRHGRYLAHLVSLGYTPCETEQQMIDGADLALPDAGDEEPDFDEHPDWQDEG